jgi:hypothetical protein
MPETTGITVHEFAATREACDAAQTRRDVRDGDVLVVPAEGVIGILFGARPYALTRRCGAFHAFDGDLRTVDAGRYERSFARALGEQDTGMRIRIPGVAAPTRPGCRVRDIDTGRTGTVEALASRGAVARVRWDNLGKASHTTDIGTIRLVPTAQPPP